MSFLCFFFISYCNIKLPLQSFTLCDHHMIEISCKSDQCKFIIHYSIYLYNLIYVSVYSIISYLVMNVTSYVAHFIYVHQVSDRNC